MLGFRISLPGGIFYLLIHIDVKRSMLPKASVAMVIEIKDRKKTNLLANFQ